MKTIHIIAHGTVQGVCFRDNTAAQARDLGVAGYVRNLPDGTVEIVAQGDPGAVEALVAWARRGPPAAEVTGLTVEDGDATVRFDGFERRP